MIPLFVTAAAASYLLARAICLKTSSDPKASSDGESQGSSWMCLTFGVILLLITIAIAVWIWWDKIAVYGWLDLDHVLASPGLSIFVLGVLTGVLVAYWHTKVLPIYSFHINTKLHIIWLCTIGSLVLLGIALPLLSLIFREMGLRSLQTPAFSVEFPASQSIGRSPLQFKVERHKLKETRLVNLTSLSPILKKDIDYLKKKGEDEEIEPFENAKLLSDKYLDPITQCVSFAFWDRQLDMAQLLPHIGPIAHALRRLLIEDSKLSYPLSAEDLDKAKEDLQQAMELVKERVSMGREGLLQLVGPPLKPDQCPQMTLNDQTISAAKFSKVPHLYVFIASIYLIGHDPDAALAVLKEGDSESPSFRNEINYNRLLGWVLYILQRPLSESIKFHERAFDFAEQVVETEGDRKFLRRYARAQRMLRTELAFLLAQAGLRKGDALAYARTYFEEVNGQSDGAPRSESSIAIGWIKDWQKSKIYTLWDEVNSYIISGYVLMAFGAREVEPNIKALRTARKLFREGLEVYHTKKGELAQKFGERNRNILRIQLESYLEHAEFLIMQAVRPG